MQLLVKPLLTIWNQNLENTNILENWHREINSSINVAKVYDSFNRYEG